MKRHLRLFVCVFVVHIVDHVHRLDIGAREPFAVEVHSFKHLAVIEDLSRIRLPRRADLRAAFFVASAVQAHQQQLREIRARAEELHLLTYPHGRDAAGYRVIVAVYRAHEVVVFILNGVRVARHPGGEELEGLRQSLRPQHGEVRLRGRPEVVKRVEHTEGAFRHQRAAVLADASERLRYPHRVAGEEVVIFRSAKMARHAQLYHEVVDYLLRAALVERSARDVAFKIYIKEG